MEIFFLPQPCRIYPYPAAYIYVAHISTAHLYPRLYIHRRLSHERAEKGAEERENATFGASRSPTTLRPIQLTRGAFESPSPQLPNGNARSRRADRRRAEQHAPNSHFCGPKGVHRAFWGRNFGGAESPRKSSRTNAFAKKQCGNNKMQKTNRFPRCLGNFFSSPSHVGYISIPLYIHIDIARQCAFSAEQPQGSETATLAEILLLRAISNGKTCQYKCHREKPTKHTNAARRDVG